MVRIYLIFINILLIIYQILKLIMNTCIACNMIVDNVQQAVTCDICTRWCHINCGTGISSNRYVQMLQGVNIPWACIPCREI